MMRSRAGDSLHGHDLTSATGCAPDPRKPYTMTGRPRKHAYAEEPDNAARTRATRAAQRQAGIRLVQIALPEETIAKLDAMASARNITRHQMAEMLIRDAG
jgi:hypothetical protein